MDLLDDKFWITERFFSRILWNTFSVTGLSLEIDVFWSFGYIVTLAEEIKKFFLFLFRFRVLASGNIPFPIAESERNGISVRCFASPVVEEIQWIIHSIFRRNLFHLSIRFCHFFLASFETVEETCITFKKRRYIFFSWWMRKEWESEEESRPPLKKGGVVTRAAHDIQLRPPQISP